MSEVVATLDTLRKQANATLKEMDGKEFLLNGTKLSIVGYSVGQISGNIAIHTTKGMEQTNIEEFATYIRNYEPVEPTGGSAVASNSEFGEDREQTNAEATVLDVPDDERFIKQPPAPRWKPERKSQPAIKESRRPHIKQNTLTNNSPIMKNQSANGGDQPVTKRPYNKTGKYTKAKKDKPSSRAAKLAALNEKAFGKIEVTEEPVVKRAYKKRTAKVKKVKKKAVKPTPVAKRKYFKKAVPAAPQPAAPATKKVIPANVLVQRPAGDWYQIQTKLGDTGAFETISIFHAVTGAELATCNNPANARMVCDALNIAFPDEIETT